LCAAGGYRGLVYSRTGYGRSTPRPHGERWTPEYMHEQAREVLPQFLCAAGVDVATDPPWLFGHSDGASIALIHAAACPDAVAGLILLAPHIFVEDLSVQSIEQAKYAYAGTDLRSRLARHHADVDSAFWGWNDIWLDPAFRRWNIEGLLASIRVPVLAVQGHNDEYGTMAQVDGLAARVPQAEVLKLDDCAAATNDTARGDIMKRRNTLAALLASALLAFGGTALAQAKLKVGVMLPFTGTYAALGTAIDNGFKLYVQEQGGKLGGREIEYFVVDDESDPSKATDNVNKLINRDKVDVIVGTVHSGVAMAMAKAARDSNTLLIVPNAGADAVTGPFCAPNIFRSSFSNWQPGYAMGKVAAERKHKTAVTITWKYAAGDESVGGFREAFEKGGGKVVKDLTVPFPNVEFQALLTEIAALKPDIVYTFFAGGGAVKFVKDYAAAGLNKTIPLYGAGFLTDGTLEAQGDAAQGLQTALHYADSLNTPRDNAFRLAYVKAYKLQPDVYAVQGYDAAQMLAIGLNAVKGDVSKRAEFAAAIEKATIDSPRGPFKLSKAHNPVQDIYLRKVEGKQNKVAGIAAKALADPARGCKM
jgi:branched-chain amino acid transport system substrate-binding protein